MKLTLTTQDEGLAERILTDYPLLYESQIGRSEKDSARTYIFRDLDHKVILDFLGGQVYGFQLLNDGSAISEKDMKRLRA